VGRCRSYLVWNVWEKHQQRRPSRPGQFTGRQELSGKESSSTIRTRAEYLKALRIESYGDLQRFLAADLARHGESPVRSIISLPQCRWLIRLRITEWWCNCHQGRPSQLFGAVLRWRLQAAAVKLGYTIAINRLGPGIRLPHWGTIVINGDAAIGANCQILPDVVIGGNDLGLAPTVEDNVFIGPGVKIIGSVTVGSGAVLLPGAVVIQDIPAGEKWGGVPATPRVVQRTPRV